MTQIRFNKFERPNNQDLTPESYSED